MGNHKGNFFIYIIKVVKLLPIIFNFKIFRIELSLCELYHRFIGRTGDVEPQMQGTIYVVVIWEFIE